MIKHDPTKPTEADFPVHYDNLMEQFNKDDDRLLLLNVLANAYDVTREAIEIKITALLKDRIDNSLKQTTKNENETKTVTKMENENETKTATEKTVTTETETKEYSTATPVSVGGVDFAAEMKRVESMGGDYLKLVEGVNTLEFLDNGGELHTETIGDQRVEKRDFKVKVGSETTTFSISPGGKLSIYGQLIAYGLKYGGLAGKKVSIQRNGMGKDSTRYTVIDLPAN